MIRVLNLFLFLFVWTFSCNKNVVKVDNSLIYIQESEIATSKHEVTVGEFEAFVDATSYTSTADSLGWSGVYDEKARKWIPVPDANWSKQKGKDAFEKFLPVTQVSYFDACAYCAWKGGRLPSALEWDKLAGEKLTKGNYWEGFFPIIDNGTDGYHIRSAPVGLFEENKYGLKDVYGNVWEWTSTAKKGQRIIKGGSFLCDINVCAGFTPGNHQLTPDDSGLNHLGFRCVYDGEP